MAESAGEVVVERVPQLAVAVGGRCNGFLGCDLAQMCAQAVADARHAYLKNGTF